MKVLVTGGSGFIGCNFVRHLIHTTDHAVVNLDKLTYAANPSSLQDLENHDRYQFVRGDIGDPACVEQVFNQFEPDSVVNLAAESHVDRSIDAPEQFLQSNILGTYQLLQAAIRWRCRLSSSGKSAFRFIQVSTDEVFGSSPGNVLTDEQAPYQPSSPYAASKASADHLARSWFKTFRLPVIVTYSSNNYGPFQFPEKLVPLIILKCLRQEPIPIYGSGEQIRDWLYVADHAEALRRVLEQGTPGETYNLAGNCRRTNLEVARTICGILDERRARRSGKRYAELLTLVEDRPGHDQRYALATSKIAQELDWQPAARFERAIAATVDWYLAHPQWVDGSLRGGYHLERLGLPGYSHPPQPSGPSGDSTDTQRG